MGRPIKFEARCKRRRKKPEICMHIMVEGGRFDQPSRNKGEIRADPKSKLILPFCRVLITALLRRLQRIADLPLSLMQNRLPKVAPARRKRDSYHYRNTRLSPLESGFSTSGLGNRDARRFVALYRGKLRNRLVKDSEYLVPSASIMHEFARSYSLSAISVL